MKKIILLALSLNFFELTAQQNNDYFVKYLFDWQKEPNNKASSFRDVMALDITKTTTTYYSINKQIGWKNGKEDQDARKDFEFTQKNPQRYYVDNESEIILINRTKGTTTFYDKLRFGGTEYTFTENTTKPIWQISEDTLKILDIKCQKASTNFKGRSYTAWFAPSLPFNAGPWLFSGLPGLILRITDNKNEIQINCIELSQKPFVKLNVYKNCESISKKELRNLKKLKATDMAAFDELQYPGITVSVTRSDGSSTPPNRKRKKLYNPLDLSEK
jgi:GLPGLI family protein